MSCTRASLGGAIEIRAMERYCWRKSLGVSHPNYYIQKQNKTICIIGGGLLGTVCAVKLAGRGFDVTLAEKKDRLWPRLWAEGSVPSDVLRIQQERLSDTKGLNILLECNIDDASRCEGDVVFFAAKQRPQIEPDKMQNGRRIIYRSHMKRMEQSGHVLAPLKQGVRMSYMLENYAKIGNLQIKSLRNPDMDFRPNIRGKESLSPALPYMLGDITDEHIQAEASRCLDCRCQNCVDCCEMMAWFGKNPKQLLSDVNATLNKTILVKKTAQTQIMSCTQCGVCQTVCPVGIDMKRLFMDSRRILKQKGELPPAAYAFWLNDMTHANSEDSSVLIAGVGKTEYLYFPGCQLGADEPEYVTRSWQWMQSVFGGNAAILLGCCGAPAHWAGESELHLTVTDSIRQRWAELGEPVIVYACPTCAELLTQYLPEARIKALWQLMAEYDDAVEGARGERGSIFVFDPCSSRDDHIVPQSIRQLLKNRGYEIEAAEDNGRRLCCGYGGLAVSGNPAVVDRIAAADMDLSVNDYVTWCSNCRDNFVGRGKRAAHILDILMWPDEDRFSRPAPNLSKRRDNRPALRGMLLGEYPDGIRDRPSGISLFIPRNVQEKMNKNLILEENVRSIIEAAKSGGILMKDMSTGLLTSYLRQGNLTFWVQYTEEDDRHFRIHNVYSHRMEISKKA
jgi:Fe-S oxidoreductase